MALREKIEQKKKSTFDFFIYFYLYERSGKKKLNTSGKKNKKFYPHRYRRNPEKTFFRPFLMNIHQKKQIEPWGGT